MSSLDEKFGGWLGEVIPSFTVEDRDKRLALIRTFAPTVVKADIVALVMLFYLAKTDGALPDRLRAAMRNDVEANFSEKNNAELAVMAAGLLYELLDRGGITASIAGLLLMSAEFGSLAQNARVQDVVEHSYSFLVEEGIRLRERNINLPNLESLLGTALENPTGEKSPEDEDETVDEEADADNEIPAPLQRIVRVLGEYGAAINEAIGAVESCRTEESNILYWLLSGRRRIQDSLLKQIKKQAAVIPIGFELAALTKQIPGPASASPILLGLLEQCKDSVADLSIEDCVNSVSAQDGDRFVSMSRSLQPVLMPLTYGLEKAKENGWKKGWQNAFQTQTGFDPAAKHPVLRIAEQVYREVLLSRVLGAE